MGYETFSHEPYSSDNSFTDYHLFKHLEISLHQKTFYSKELETAFLGIKIFIFLLERDK